MGNYKGIEFAEGYNKPFADFKEEFEQTHIFKNIPSAERENALKEAHKIAVDSKDLLEIKVTDAKVETPNGNTSRPVKKSEETK